MSKDFHGAKRLPCARCRLLARTVVSFPTSSAASRPYPANLCSVDSSAPIGRLQWAEQRACICCWLTVCLGIIFFWLLCNHIGTHDVTEFVKITQNNKHYALQCHPTFGTNGKPVLDFRQLLPISHRFQDMTDHWSNFRCPQWDVSRSGRTPEFRIAKFGLKELKHRSIVWFEKVFDILTFYGWLKSITDGQTLSQQMLLLTTLRF